MDAVTVIVRMWTTQSRFFADQIDQLVNELRLDTPFSLVGLSMGGPIVTYYTNRKPQNIKRLVLVDPMVFAPSEEDIGPLALPMIGEYFAGVYLMPQLAAGQAGDFQDKDQFSDWEDRFIEQMQYHGFRAAILSTIRNFPAFDTLSEYQDLGEKDLPVQLSWVRRLL